MKVPIVCYTDDCSRRGSLVNMVSNISPPDLDMFYEAFTEPEEADFCPACGQLGLMEDPEIEHAWHDLSPRAVRPLALAMWEIRLNALLRAFY